MPATARKIVRQTETQEEAHEPRKRPERLSPAELAALVRKGRAAKSEAERKRIEDEFIRGFYGK